MEEDSASMHHDHEDHLYAIRSGCSTGWPVLHCRRVGRGASVLPGSPPPFPLLSHTMPLLASFSLTVEQEILINS